MAREPISADEELQRLQPVLADVVALGIPVSIDSMKSAVVAWALDAGRGDRQRRLGPAARSRHGAAGRRARRARHRHAQPRRRRSRHRHHEGYRRFLRALARRSPPRPAFRRDNIVLDPGIGFGKTPEQSMTALARLDELQHFGLPLLVGASRKRFISTVSPSEPHQRLGGSIAAHLMAAQNGAQIIRAHDVAETVQALRVARAHQDSDDRYDLHHRRRHPCPSRRDGTRDRGRAAFRHRSRTLRRSRRSPRAPIASPTPCPIPTWWRPRPRRSRTPITNCWSAPPAPWPTRSWRRFRTVSAVKVTVHKPHAPIAAIFEDVGVILTRTRQRRRMADVADRARRQCRRRPRDIPTRRSPISAA